MTRVYDSPIWRKSVRPAVLARDGYRCQIETAPGRICGRLAREAGHRVALVDGGEPFQMLNLEAQCRAHNAADGGRIARRRSNVSRQSRRW
jgi:hypothetical protein